MHTGNGPYVLVFGAKNQRVALSRMLMGRYRFDTAESEGEALRLVTGRPYHVVIAALEPEGVGGVNFVRAGFEAGANFRMILLTEGHAGVGEDDLNSTVYDCLDYPLSSDRLIRTIEKAWHLIKVERSHSRLREKLKEEVRERKEVTGALKMKDHALFHSINALFFAGADGTVFAANPAFLQLWGYGEEGEVVGRSVDHFFTMDRGFSEWRYRLMVRGALHREMMAVKKDSTIFPVQASISLYGREHQQCEGVMGAFIDLTERNRNEEFKLQSLKLLALGHLSAGLAHELRNPLAVISSCAQFSIENLSIERPLAENLQVIYRNSQKASRLIEELLSFAKPSKLDWKQVSVNAMLAHVLRMAKLEAKRARIDTLLETDPNLPRIIGDQEKLEQVFLNITLNAFQAVSKTGRVTLRTQYVKAGKMVEVNVIDNGPGIPEEYREQVFDPFFTTKDNGTGLGLSISHSIIKQHGGQIRINCDRKNETNISILLPIENRAK